MLRIRDLVVAGTLLLLATTTACTSATAGGCRSSSDCEDRSLLCELPKGQCKNPEAKGTCEKKPDACTQNFNPVCGCDGQTYPNDCDRKMKGAQLDHEGECKG